jgi:hypothetical protein
LLNQPKTEELEKDPHPVALPRIPTGHMTTTKCGHDTLYVVVYIIIIVILIVILNLYLNPIPTEIIDPNLQRLQYNGCIYISLMPGG